MPLSDENIRNGLVMEQFEKFIGKSITTILTYCLVFIVLLPFIIYQAWVIVLYWKWFIMPIFNFKQITILYAIVLQMFVQMFRSSPRPNPDDKIWNDTIKKPLIKITTILIVGYVIHFYIN
jgi:hypothetical protein